MTRKDYKLIAEALRRAKPKEHSLDWLNTVWEVAEHLRLAYPNFDYSKFMTASGRNEEFEG